MKTRKKILLVDDVQLFLEQEQSFFDRRDFKVLMARKGGEALEIARAEKPDLIFMDYYMPDINGDSCCQRIKSDDTLCKIPVIMVTAGVGGDDFQKCWDAGCDGIIPKPINRNYFDAIIKKFISVAEREAPRYVARLRVQYGHQERVFDNYSVNVSTGGLFLETSAPLPVGTELRLSFDLPDSGRTIQCEGRVAWLNHQEVMKVSTLPPGVGVQFSSLSCTDLDAIRTFLKKGALVGSW